MLKERRASCRGHEAWKDHGRGIDGKVNEGASGDTTVFTS